MYHFKICAVKFPFLLLFDISAIRTCFNLCYISVVCTHASFIDHSSYFREYQINFYSIKESSRMKGLAVIVLVGAFVIAAEGACTFNKWDSLDDIPFFYNSDGNNRVNSTIV